MSVLKEAQQLCDKLKVCVCVHLALLVASTAWC